MHFVRNQRGFSVIEAALIVMILAAITFAGYYAWRAQHQLNKVYDSTSKAAQSAPNSILHPAKRPSR